MNKFHSFRYSFICLLFLLCEGIKAQQPLVQSVGLNQIGFYPEQTKHIYIAPELAKHSPRLLLPDGTLTDLKSFKSSRKNIYNISSIDQPGIYNIVAKGYADTVRFVIENNIYDTVVKSLIKGFYYQRSDQPLLPEHAGIWARPAGHPDTAVQVHASAASSTRPENTLISSAGGWYDAGDYNKYIVNCGITMSQLLHTYEDFPGYISGLSLNIPESDNQLPDLLDEVLYNLRWMFTMQDPADGGVYHKLTNAVFDGFVMPGVTKDARYVVQKSTAAALNFTAVMAQAARVFRSFENILPRLSDSCMQAAEKAWHWASLHQNQLYRQQEMNKVFHPAVETGEYGDSELSDEWFWAAAEMYINTGSPLYGVRMQELMKTVQMVVPTWNQTAILGCMSLKKHAAADISRQAETAIMELARRLIKQQRSSPFGTVMGGNIADYVWGSSAVAANQGMVLVYAWMITEQEEYREAAMSNFDYLLGRNGLGLCMITGLGTYSPLHPHHRPSIADGIIPPVPGLLVGGPNPGRQDGVQYPDLAPARSYVDDENSYASNEIAINWNAPAVYLSTAIAYLGK